MVELSANAAALDRAHESRHLLDVVYGAGGVGEGENKGADEDGGG